MAEADVYRVVVPACNRQGNYVGEIEVGRITVSHGTPDVIFDGSQSDERLSWGGLGLKLSSFKCLLVAPKGI